MKAATDTTQPNRHSKTLTRRADEPFRLPLEDYYLSFTVLLELTGRKKKRTEIWYPDVIRFRSFQEGKLVLTTTLGRETHTLTLLLAADHLLASCSCASPAATLCSHLYRYLFNAARFGDRETFADFRPGGLIETALRHPAQFTIHLTGRHGIQVQFKRGPGSVYALESGVTIAALAPYLQLPASQPLPPPTATLGYLLMMSPREEQAPFILPCPGTLTKDGSDIKVFNSYLLDTATATTRRLVTAEALPRVQACTEIMKLAEGLPGMAGIDDSPAAVGQLEALLQRFHSYLPRFKEAHTYLCTCYGKKYLQAKPVRRWLYPVQLKTGVVRLQFSLQCTKDRYQLKPVLLIDGKVAAAYERVAGFFLASADRTEAYLFASLRDAAMVYWMNRRGGVITVFPEHFAAFEQEVLREIARHYVVKRTGGKGSGEL